MTAATAVSGPKRLAMWSGPRNISTAMMRAWGSRPDTFVCDEPLYAFYLHATGLPHPARDEVIAAGETDWKTVVAWLTGDVPERRTLFFQKHMAHHLLAEIDRGWLARVSNCLLIRDPREVIVSYVKKNVDPTPHDLGYPQQVEIFQWLVDYTGAPPPVLDARDVLESPARMLGQLCDWLGVPFTPQMLTWAPGLRATDGVWAQHWYSEVEHSTGFRPYVARHEEVPSRLLGVYQECAELYAQLHARRMT